MDPKLFLIIVIIVSSQIKLGYCCEESGNTTTYIPPGNMKFPYGDEYQMSCDVLENDTNLIICQDKIDIIPEYGRCPFPPADPEDMKLTNPYVKCPDFPQQPPPGLLPPPGISVVASEALCKSCDLQLTPDGVAVNLKCICCHDFPSLERSVNLIERDLVLTAYFVQIANYTSVIVTGQENVNT
ncbi:unnamed protein product [Ceutorhynchus assimilis]|uniref:Uncharacterized protein n=1 Tax=Ceutorhynchus assimilis TaxID=467358 RepID=A0A9N9QNL7_9CUCU|nr:unnamed protein product [Ceutorhynchus assimilis]